MLKRSLLPILLVATFASLPALAQDDSATVTTKSQRISADQITAKMQVSALNAGLPLSWCGTPSSTDLSVNATANADPKFKFYYVRASDQPDRFSEVADVIQNGVATIHSYLLTQSASARTVALDLGTACGPLYVDITNIVLPGTRDSYLDQSGQIDIEETIDRFDSMANLIPGPPRHHIFMLDQFDPPGYIEGGGVMSLDDSPSSGNANNRPGLVGYVALPEGPSTQPVVAAFPQTLLHEMTHTMGAVQPSAPNSTSAGHCIDGKDVMCYDDLSPEGLYYSDAVCPGGGDLELAGFAYDCNRDDYFNPAPAAGSHLATHWNVFNSKYLIKCVAADPYCTSVPKSDPLPTNPAARNAANSLYSYTKGKRRKKVGTVTATGAREVGTSFVRNSVAMSKLRLPKKSKWKVTICFRESGTHSICESKTRKTGSSGYLTMPRIYVTTDIGPASAYGSVSVKPLTKKYKSQRYEIRTSKTPIKYALDFE